MKKGLKITLLVIGVLVLFVVVAGAILYNVIIKDDIEVAFLTVEKETVKVDQGNGWETVTGELSLSLDDKIKTEDGVAVLTLFESILIELEPNTEVSLASLSEKKSAIKQASGSTWTKFISVAGIKNFEIETPNTVATVRGTEFGIVVGKEDAIMVAEGIVITITNGKSLDLNAFEISIKGEKGEMTAKDIDHMLAKTKKTLIRIKGLRDRIIDEYQPKIETFAAEYDVTEVGLRGDLALIDKGELDDEVLFADAPVQLPVMGRFKDLNDEVKNQQRLIERIESLKGS